jgi:3D (Asp-Asp-Asp) domain-containing protein
MRAYAVGNLLMPWRVARHSLFISGLSLLIATGAIVAGTFLQRNETPTVTRASASAPQQQRAGESTSVGALTRFVKAAGSSQATPASSTSTSQTEEAPSGGNNEAATPAADGDAGGQAESRAAAPVVSHAPMIAERPADQGDLLVTSARFKVKPLPTVSETTTRTLTAAATVPDLQAGDRLTVPVTFYYCEDSTSGQRRGDGGGFCGVMRDGTTVYSGAAACEYQYLGQRFRIEGDPTGRTYVCADTGSGIHGQHRDIWFMTNGEGWAWQQVVGRYAVIQVLP